jgi:glutamate-ammonia-ligase adenylyltransferase
VTGPLETRLREALAGSPLAAGLPRAAAPLLERRSGDAAVGRLAGPVLLGLARGVASQPELAGFLSHRPQLLERIADADADALARRAAELAAEAQQEPAGDLETELDALRLRRREETALAVCCELGGSSPFEAVSEFLSILAETITARALRLARRGAGSGTPDFAVVGMGKIAGREFTHHSDLDLIFLHAGGADEVAPASRIGQRLIAYLTTMTGAGVAYAVDTRLRPSGQKGMLVTSFDGFTRYQKQTAETWEHLALLRARPIAGELAQAEAALSEVRAEVLRGGGKPWRYLADLRARVERERANEAGGRLAFKTGPGGLMDIDFLAGGGLLERGTRRFPAFPSVAAMLACTLAEARTRRLRADYAALRVIEARARWVAGRAVEELPAEGEALARVAELVEAGVDAGALLARVRAVRERTRAAYRAVVEAGTIEALPS